MTDNFEEEVEEIVKKAQKLDEWKQKLIEDAAAHGEDLSDARIVVAGYFNGNIEATDLTGYPKKGEAEAGVKEWSHREALEALTPDACTLSLSVIAVNAREIREELEEVVFNYSSDEFAVWALEHLSPYTSAAVLAEANLKAVKHNIKTLIRMEKSRG